MTKATGPKKKQNRKNYQYLRKSGTLAKRREFIDYDYLNGVKAKDGSLASRPLNAEEIDFLNKFTKEYYHATFTTDEESKKQFKKINSMLESDWVHDHYKEFGKYPVEVENALDKFSKKTEKLGNFHSNIFDQKDINSDDYKREHDIHNKMNREFKLDCYDLVFKSTEVDNIFEDKEDTFIEDLITENED